MCTNQKTVEKVSGQMTTKYDFVQYIKHSLFKNGNTEFQNQIHCKVGLHVVFNFKFNFN